MNVRYLTADVFTDTRFGGNQLAVFPDAREIRAELMPRIAREFNYSETTFVLPAADPSHTAKVRIFTPGGELPFAGHPTIGTAHVLASIGAVKLSGDETRIVLEEGVGPVPVVIRAESGQPTFAQLTAARVPERGPAPPDRDRLAAAVCLSPDDILTDGMTPEAVSCGTPFLFVPVRDRATLGRARVNYDRWDETFSNYITQNVFLFALDPELPGHDVRARMFAPTIGVAEDPATGGACIALGGYLAWREPRTDGTFRWVVEQGFEMGRPSILEVEADKQQGRVTAARVGGRTVLVCDGTFTL